jgi:hypothetical protein
MVLCHLVKRCQTEPAEVHIIISKKQPVSVFSTWHWFITKRYSINEAMSDWACRSPNYYFDKTAGFGILNLALVLN